MEIHRADPAHRKRALLLLALATVLCACLLWLLHHWLHQVHAQLMASAPATMRRWLRGLLVGLGLALSLPAALLGGWFRKLALGSRAEGRFPPRGLKTMRDIHVLRGADALRWAKRVETTGRIALALAVAVLAWTAWCWWRFN